MSEPVLHALPVNDRSAQGIAHAIGRLISDGALSPGEKLPTVRAAANELGVSPTTVGEAWRILQRHGAILTDGRRGTFVRSLRSDTAPGRYWQVPVGPGAFEFDLSTGTPDPTLLPQLGPSLGRIQSDPTVTSYLEDAVLPSLHELLITDWPFAPRALTIVDGAQDALDRLVQAVLHVGDTVMVNDPAFPPLLDMFDEAGVTVIGIPIDDEGPSLDSVRAALDAQPQAFFLQPRAHNPTGVAVSSRRADALAELLAGSDVLVVEDDHSGAVSGAPLASLGAALPDQVVHVRSYSKSHGPDLRLAAIGGAARPIEAVTRRRRLGPSWSSRLLQQLLVDMLTDPEAQAAVEAADRCYLERRRRFTEALARAGVAVGGASGINLWVPVADEQIALVSLAAAGIGAAPGGPFMVTPGDPHIRVSIARLDAELEHVAAQVALAATATAR